MSETGGVGAPDLTALHRCFQGILPSTLTTCSADGLPNVAALSQVYLVEPGQLAVSCQFFNKTRRNLAENPYAELGVIDPLDLQDYRISVKFQRAETSGPLFDGMSLRLEAIASLSGMQGVFKLRSADLFQVLAAERAPSILRVASEAEAPADGRAAAEVPTGSCARCRSWRSGSTAPAICLTCSRPCWARWPTPLASPTRCCWSPTARASGW